MAKKIEVMQDDQNIYDGTFDRLYVYRSIISLLSDVKLCQGPEAIRASLRRHPLISNYLLSFQKDNIIKLEGKIKILGDAKI